MLTRTLDRAKEFDMQLKRRLAKQMPSTAVLVALIALVLAIGGTAIAGLPGQDGAISACYRKQGGALRVIAGSKSCAKGEKQIAWNRLGPTGPRGATGAPGPRGDVGERGPQGEPGLSATSLWAAVRANGTKSRGSGVTSTTKIGTGFYEVTFGQSVSSCGFDATLGSPDTLEIPAGQTGASQNLGGGFSNLPTQVLVSTTNSAGSATDMPFFLTVIC
jgi:hypothetical protein